MRTAVVIILIVLTALIDGERTHSHISNPYCRVIGTTSTSGSSNAEQQCNTVNACDITKQTAEQSATTGQGEPFERPSCAVRAQAGWMWTVVIPLPNTTVKCSIVDIQNSGYKFNKVNNDGSVTDVLNHLGNADYTSAAAVLSTVEGAWCNSTRLNIQADPFGSTCAITIKHKADLLSTGLYQAILPSANGSNVIQQYVVTMISPRCEDCYDGKTCTQLSTKTQGAQSTLQLYPGSVEVGTKGCFVLDGGLVHHSDTVYWSFISNSRPRAVTAVQWSSIQTNSRGESVVVSVSNYASVAVYGSSARCLVIEDMSSSTAGVYVYQDGSAAVNGSVNVVPAINVSALRPTAKTPATQDASSTTSGIASGFVLALIFGIILVVMKVHGLRKDPEDPEN